MDELSSLSYSRKYSCKYCGEYLLDTHDQDSLSRESEMRFKIACVLNAQSYRQIPFWTRLIFIYTRMGKMAYTDVLINDK